MAVEVVAFFDVEVRNGSKAGNLIEWHCRWLFDYVNV